MTFASMKDAFAAKDCMLLGLSVDSNPSHIAWIKDMGKYTWNNIRNPQITFPIIADHFGAIAKQYGMLMPTASQSKTVRSVFMIDPEGTVRAVLNYPLTTGRNIDEIYRLLLALQAYDATGNPTPANWQPGGEQIVSPPQTFAQAQERLEGQVKGGYHCLDWYLCFTGQSENSNAAAPAMKSENSKMAVAPATQPNTSRKSESGGMPEMSKNAAAVKPGMWEQPSVSPSVTYPPQRPSPEPPAMPKKQPYTGVSPKASKGIMEQNRFLLGSMNEQNDLPGFNEIDHFLTRDYPYKQ